MNTPHRNHFASGHSTVSFHVSVHASSIHQARSIASSLSIELTAANLHANATALSPRKLLVHTALSTPVSYADFPANIFPQNNFGGNSNVFPGNEGISSDETDESHAHKVVKILAQHSRIMWVEPRPQYKLLNKYAAINVQSGIKCPPCHHEEVCARIYMYIYIYIYIVA